MRPSFLALVLAIAAFTGNPTVISGASPDNKSPDSESPDGGNAEINPRPLPPRPTGALLHLIGTGSLLTVYIQYFPDGSDPLTYVAPQPTANNQPIYDFVRAKLRTELPRMSPADLTGDASQV